MSPALPAGTMHGGHQSPPWKRGLCPQTRHPAGIPKLPQALFWTPSTPWTLSYRKKNQQDFWGSRYRQALKSYSKIIIQRSYGLHVFSDSSARRCQAQPWSRTADWGKCNSLALPWASLYMCLAQCKTGFIFYCSHGPHCPW